MASGAPPQAAGAGSTRHAPPPVAMKHFAYQCPGLHGPGSRMLIEPRSFAQVLSGDTAVVIPLFQRAYCWKDEQFTKWWDDVLVGRRASTVDGSHGTGKIFFTRQGGYTAGGVSEVLVCIDGQQRITTCSLLAAAIRDAALRVCRQTKASDAPTSKLASDLADTLNCVLLSDKEAAEKWREDAVDKLLAAWREGGEDALAQCWDSLHEVGAALPFTRLVPSYVDRRAFFQLATVGWVQHALWEAVGDEAPEIRLSPRVLSTHQGAGKAIFDSSIERFVSSRASAKAQRLMEEAEAELARQSATGPPEFDVTVTPAASDDVALDSRRVVQALQHVARRAIPGFSMIYMEVLNEISMPQVFLWLQEKSLFSLGSLLWNPAPGVKFRASDMCRNLILSPLMDRDLPEQEAMYRKLWIEPLEMKVAAGGLGGADQIDDVLLLWLRSIYGDDVGNPRRATSGARQKARQQGHKARKRSSVEAIEDDADGSESSGGGCDACESSDVMGPPPPKRTAARKPWRSRLFGTASEAADEPPKRFVSKFEETIVGVATHPMAKAENLPGILLYAAFQSHVEYLQRRYIAEASGGKVSEESAEPDAASLLRVEGPLLAELAEFVDHYVAERGSSADAAPSSGLTGAAGGTSSRGDVDMSGRSTADRYC